MEKATELELMAWQAEAQAIAALLENAEDTPDASPAMICRVCADALHTLAAKMGKAAE